MKLISSKFFLALLVVACAVQVSNGLLLDTLGSLLNLLGGILGGLLGLVGDILKSLLSSKDSTTLTELGPLIKAHITVVDKLLTIIKNMTTVRTTDSSLNNLVDGIVLSTKAVNVSIQAYFYYIVSQTPNSTLFRQGTCRSYLTKAVADYNSNIFVTNINYTYSTLVPKLLADVTRQGSCVPVEDVCSTTCTIVYDIPYDIEDVDKYCSGFPAVAYEGYRNLHTSVQTWVKCLNG